MKKLLENTFVRNFSWMAGGELIVRISRLLTTLVLARYLSQTDYGLAALAIASAEIVRILASNGIGNLIVKSAEEKLVSISHSVFWANLVVGIAMFLIQWFGATFIGEFYSSGLLADMLKTLAITHLIYPFAMVQFNLLQRASRMREASLIMAGTVATDNILSAVLVLGGFGIWGVVYAKIVAALIWVVALALREPWRPRLIFSGEDFRSMKQYSKHVMFSEFLKNVRNQIDLLILGRILSAEVFGLYAFARNAGLGISLSITNGFNTALFPRLCDAMRNGGDAVASYANSLKIGLSLIAPLLLLQAFTAPIYVPIIFGEKWVAAVPLVTLLCLSALPRMLFESTSIFYRASDRISMESRIAAGFTVAFSILVFLVGNAGGQAVAIAMIAAYTFASALTFTQIWLEARRNAVSTMN